MIDSNGGSLNIDLQSQAPSPFFSQSFTPFQFHLGCFLQANPFMNLLQAKKFFMEVMRFDMSIIRLIINLFMVATQILKMNANGFVCKKV
jgi:hypothetical protein